jgi:hypothetical protein
MMVDYHSDMKEIAKALVAAQKEMGNAKKDSVNPFFKSKYADLNSVREACMPALNNHGIAVLQPHVHIDGKNFVKTLLLHESGEYIECLTEIIYNKINDAQAQGSGISYARRYGLQSLINIGAEDDDGNKAVEPKKIVEAENFDDLHNAYMIVWNEYKAATNTDEATKYHPSRWKTKSAKAYDHAIKTLNDKLETLKTTI